MYSLTDAPGALYGNNVDKKATVPMNLVGSNRPLLSFWHRYNLEDKKDYGYVEVSKDSGATWSCLFYTTGNSAEQWFKEEIDLSPFANKQVQVRFRIKTDGSGQREGWYVDDVEVSENITTTALPFLDDAETSSSDDNWIASSWQRIATDGHDSAHCWSRPAFTARSDLSTALVLRGRIDLSAVVNPQLSFSHHKSGTGDVYISPDGGHTWTRIYHNTSTWTDWRKTDVDLSTHAGLSNVALKFTMAAGQLWNIDDVEVTGESVSRPTLTAYVEAGAAKLSWTPFGTGSYTVQWSEDLNVWTAEPGMPITGTVFSIGEIPALPTRRFYRVSSP